MPVVPGSHFDTTHTLSDTKGASTCQEEARDPHDGNGCATTCSNTLLLLEGALGFHDRPQLADLFERFPTCNGSMLFLNPSLKVNEPYLVIPTTRNVLYRCVRHFLFS